MTAHALSELDSNRVAFAERIVDRMAANDIESSPEEIVRAAILTAGANVPTAREAAVRIVEMREGPAYCYLAFHGMDDEASFLKVGMSRHPEQRLYHMATGNPLDCLWVFICKASSARAAYHIEQTLLRHLAANKRRGEWVHVGNTDEAGAAAMARQLTGEARAIDPEAGEFSLLGYTDGRKVA